MYSTVRPAACRFVFRFVCSMIPLKLMRGSLVFVQRCALCHKQGDVGNDIGPNLQSVAGHTAEKLLVSILDPNASIEPGYAAYTCRLATGEEFYGIIAAETANSLVLKGAEGTAHTVLRAEILSVRGLNLSLMPEGLETDLSKQDMADLIRYLQQAAR